MSVLVVWLFCLCVSAASSHEALAYTVKKGDTLSEIAQKFFGAPTFGKNGNLDRLLALNPSIKNPDLIYPNQKINTKLNVAHTTDSLERSLASNDPAPPQEIATENGFNVATALEVSLSTSFMQINSQEKADGSRGRLSSSLSKGATIKWLQHLTGGFSTYLFVGTRRYDFIAPSNKTLEKNAITASELGVGVRYSIFKNDILDFSLSEAQQPVMYARTTNILVIDSQPIKKFKTSYEHNLLKVSNLRIRMQASGSYLSSKAVDGYSINHGWAGEGALLIDQSLKWGTLSGAFFSSFRKQDTSITKQNIAETGVSLGISIPLGKTD